MSEIKLLYHGFADEYRCQIIDWLYQKHSWKPEFIVGLNAESIRPWVASNYNECVLQDSMQLRMAQFNYKEIGDAVPLDANIINSLSPYALNFMGFLNDTTGWNYSFRERKQFYYEMLRYWNTVITNFRPELVVFSTRPHTPSCHALYLLCKHYYKINLLFLDPVPFFNKNYHIVGTSLEKLYEPFNDLYESDAEIKPGINVTEYLEDVRSEKGKEPNYLVEIYKNDHKILRKYFKHIVMLFVSTLSRGKGFHKAYSDWKKNMKPYDFLSSRMNHFEYIIFMLRLGLKNKKLQKYYEAQCVKPDINKKYIYFASPYQPEAVSSINAGAYEELFLVLDILSNCMPKDWVLYYKEHPATFLQDRKGALARNSRYYEKVCSYNNIQLISSKIDTFRMIDNSQAVATVAGTVAWESALRGKPSLSFGSAWYQGCKSIFTIITVQDGIDAISKITMGYEPDQDDLKRYAAALEKVAVKGMLHRDFDKEVIKCQDPTFELQRVGKAIYDAYERNHIE